jgi:hypothetical protein
LGATWLACSKREPAGEAPAKEGESRVEITWKGEVRSGEAFEKAFGPGLAFKLTPRPFGWEIEIVEKGRAENLARLTPPFHFVPNPRDIDGWHFRNTDNTGPNESGEKNVNAPGAEREFIFSPEVGKTIQGPDVVRSPDESDVAAVKAFGRGILRILDYALADLEPGKKARFASMRFEVTLSWPRDS